MREAQIEGQQISFKAKKIDEMQKYANIKLHFNPIKYNNSSTNQASHSAVADTSDSFTKEVQRNKVQPKNNRIVIRDY